MSPVELAMRRLGEGARALRAAREEITESLEAAFEALQATTLEDADTKSELIDKLRYLLRYSERRITCPRCGEPALPFFIRNSPSGTIQLRHRGGARGDHCPLLDRDDPKWPALKVVEVVQDDAG